MFCALFFAVVLGSGCGTVEQRRQLAQQTSNLYDTLQHRELAQRWVGKSVSDVVETLGRPDHVVLDTQGDGWVAWTFGAYEQYTVQMTVSRDTVTDVLQSVSKGPHDYE